MLNPQFFTASYQPHSPWSEALKKDFKDKIAILKATPHGLASNSLGADILKKTNLFCVAKNPHDSKFYAYAVASAACHTENISLHAKEDPWLIRLTELPDQRVSTLKERVLPIVEAVYTGGFRPEHRTKDEMLAEVSPEIHETKEAVKSWVWFGKASGVLVIIGGIVNYAPVANAIKNAAAAIGPEGLLQGGGALLVLGVAKHLLQKLPKAYTRECAALRAEPNADFYLTNQKEELMAL